MRALVYRPGMRPVAGEVAGFKGLQDTVGGFVERIILEQHADGHVVELWCDEDGISKGLPLNVLARGPLYTGAPIFGTAVICIGRPVGEGEFEYRDMTLEEIASWATLPRVVTVEPAAAPKSKRKPKGAMS